MSPLEPADTAGRAVERIADVLVEAWNRHDARSFAAAFAEDAEFTNVFGMRASGRSAIERFHAPVFATIFKDSRLASVERRARLLRDDVATLEILWEMVGARDPHGAAWPARRGLINLVATRAQDGWRIAEMHNMDLPAPALAEAQARLQAAVTAGTG
jgi:uncharacterized protein (TIGR02246 family)